MAKNNQKLPLSLHYASYLHPISPLVLSQQRQHFQSLAKTASSKPQDICRSKKTKRLPNRPRQRPSPPQLPQLPPLLQLLPSYLRLCYRTAATSMTLFSLEVMEMTCPTWCKKMWNQQERQWHRESRIHSKMLFPFCSLNLVLEVPS